MTPTDLRTLLEETGHTPQSLAHMLECTDTAVYNWLGGRIRIRRIHEIAIRAVIEKEASNANA